MLKYNFHISRDSRDKLKFEKSVYSTTGNLIIIDSAQARILSAKINELRKSEGKLDKLVTPGQLNALGLLHEIYHFLMRYYEAANPKVFSKALNILSNKFSNEELQNLLLEYASQFPPLDVYYKKETENEFLNKSFDGKSGKEIILEELLLLYFENINPAANLFEDLFSDKKLYEKTKYINVIDELEEFFRKEKPFGTENVSLMEFLKKPLVNSPFSLENQLDYIIGNWKIYVYDKFHKRLLKSKDLISEDQKLFMQHGFEKATPPVPEYDFDKEYFLKMKRRLEAGEDLSEDERNLYYSEIEHFTKDIDWMPKVVMIAKNAFVWLDQLSKKYQRDIRRLDQVPDEELDMLAGWNFNSLWLIGIWERSSASRKIKHLTGNLDAVSSAYSLYDYVIANDLGGEEAFQNLKDRAFRRGIRIGSDMVPNHTGIYSKWVIEKPDFFIQSDRPPFPGYSFYGPNLSDDPRVEVRIEDKYYTREDAAVVFQRKDSYTGGIKYIYHGNDGTHMPWNDTAQLNLLNPEAREALIQTIMHVARKTSIIRLDAAMTLTKKHYQRLWFPQPGTGGAIPSRSDSAMTRSEFERYMPNEFWREVVDRINKELPETLLLAEAFWLMEGFFVRTLGMHRVYNSAFMHMMMKEENDKYRQLIKNTLEFNPEILKRYVNFMSNPDEETAVNQFGKGDKYFGVAVLMVTLPGLPMFAHGQIEGFSEKYGHEYKHSYYNESADENLVARHRFDVFPLMRKRYLFSQVSNFELYDFFENNGNITESVFAFSNCIAVNFDKTDYEKALVLYNNSYFECSGTINYSGTKNQNGNLTNKKLAQALDFKWDSRFFYSCREHKSNLEFLFKGSDINEHGIFFYLKGYEYKIFLDFKELYDHDGSYEKLYRAIGNSGVPSVEQAFIEINLIPVHDSIKKALCKVNIADFTITTQRQANSKVFENKKSALTKDFRNILSAISINKKVEIKTEDSIKEFDNDIYSYDELTKLLKVELKKKNSPKWIKEAAKNIMFFEKSKDKYSSDLTLPLFTLKNIFISLPGNGDFSQLRLSKPIFEILSELKHPQNLIFDEINLMNFISHHNRYNFWTLDPFVKNKTRNEIDKKIIQDFILLLFKERISADFLGVNYFEGVIYYNKEKFELMLDWLFTIVVLNYIKTNLKADTSIPVLTFRKRLKALYDYILFLKNASLKSKFRVKELKDILDKGKIEMKAKQTKSKTKKGS
jgi:glycosidase